MFEIYDTKRDCSTGLTFAHINVAIERCKTANKLAYQALMHYPYRVKETIASRVPRRKQTR